MWIATGVVFHLGIAMTLKLGIFPWGMLALYPVLFAPGCGKQQKEREHHAHHGHHGGGMPHRFERAEDWAPRFDDPARDAWQKPDEVIAVVGIQPGMTVVDVGAGTGYFLARLSAECGRAGAVPVTEQKLNLVGQFADYAPADAFGREAVADSRFYARLIKELDLKLEQ